MPVPLILPERCADGTEMRVQRWARPLLGIAGLLFASTGIGLAAAGAFSRSDGSTFDLLAGLGLAASGVLLARRPIAGAAVYMAVFAGTLIWSLRDLGLGGSSLLYRLIGPMIMLSMILALAPALLRLGGRCGLALASNRARILVGGSGEQDHAPYLKLPCTGVLP